MRTLFYQNSPSLAIVRPSDFFWSSVTLFHSSDLQNSEKCILVVINFIGNCWKMWVSNVGVILARSNMTQSPKKDAKRKFLSLNSNKNCNFLFLFSAHTTEKPLAKYAHLFTAIWEKFAHEIGIYFACMKNTTTEKFPIHSSRWGVPKRYWWTWDGFIRKTNLAYVPIRPGTVPLPVTPRIQTSYQSYGCVTAVELKVLEDTKRWSSRQIRQLKMLCMKVFPHI